MVWPYFFAKIRFLRGFLCVFTEKNGTQIDFRSFGYGGEMDQVVRILVNFKIWS